MLGMIGIMLTLTVTEMQWTVA